MGAQNYLLAQKQTLAAASLIAGVLLFIFSVYTVTNAESLPNSATDDVAQQATLTEDVTSGQSSVDSELQIAADVTTSSGQEDPSHLDGEVEIVKPVAPIKPLQPTVPAVGTVESKPDTEPHQSVPDESDEESPQATNDSNVRIRLRDRSRSEINGEDVDSGNHSLNLTIREEISTQ